MKKKIEVFGIDFTKFFRVAKDIYYVVNAVESAMTAVNELSDTEDAEIVETTGGDDNVAHSA